jgi:hypothetical protein
MEDKHFGFLRKLRVHVVQMPKSLLRTFFLTLVFLILIVIYGVVRGHSVTNPAFGLAGAAVICAALGLWVYQRIRKCNWNWGTEFTAIVIFGVAAVWIMAAIWRGMSRGP